ncbi:uncharacterized protein LOC141588197 [Silene latifolia]|uniref:uncharacterized protein LOC141588197 n=1 Tax=Silene latifolia TaxID=37657 RepID=UPI003D788938
MLSLLISGPKQPGNDIDVYLELLIDDLKLLWDEGVEVYDAYHGETFNLRAMIFYTINDFPAYDNLSGYTVKGAKACPICEDDRSFDRLVHGGKNVYLSLRGVLPNHVRGAITRLCYFFNAIFSKVVDSDTLSTLQRDIIITMCELEIFFPPSFFDIMQHLVVHLVREIKICGPLFLRNMYPFERYMKPLGGYVRYQNRPEGCMIQGYVAEEALEFVTDYLSDVESIGLPTTRHEGRIEGQGTLGKAVVAINRDTLDQAHFYILQHTVDVHPYLEKHQTLLSAQNPSNGERWLAMQHNRLFLKWFTNEVDIELKNDRGKVSEEVRWLAHGPGLNVLSYQGYDINGYSFYTKAQDDRSTMQNSGIALMAMSMSVASAKDNTPAYDAQPYFGVINEI